MIQKYFLTGFLVLLCLPYLMRADEDGKATVRKEKPPNRPRRNHPKVLRKRAGVSEGQRELHLPANGAH